VRDHYSQAGLGVKLGKVSVYEWGCRDGGDEYADIDLDNDMERLFEKGSAHLSAESSGRAVNLFFVSKITYGSTNLTILGASGAIGGPPLNGTGASGVALSTFEKLGRFNPQCTASACPLSSQELDFIDMATTVSHEMGHYLGLNHPSEKEARRHDPIPDTPTCGADGSGTSARVTHSSCLRGSACLAACPAYDAKTRFCTLAPECQFNHLMWYTTKKINSTTREADGNLVSPQSSAVVRDNPLVR